MHIIELWYSTMTKNKIFITGGAGYIGSVLTIEWVEDLTHPDKKGKISI